MRFLDELDHLPVRDEIPLCLGRVGEEAAGHRQLAPMGSGRLLGNPGPIDPLFGIKPIANWISEPVQSPSHLNTPTRALSSAAGSQFDPRVIDALLAGVTVLATFWRALR